jgi:hypothetical protein
LTSAKDPETASRQIEKQAAIIYKVYQQAGL